MENTEPNKEINALLWVPVSLLFIALIGVATYKVWPLLNPDIAAAAPLDPDCDLRAGPCTGNFATGGSVSFAIEPDDIPVVKPLLLRVTLDGLEAHKVEVDFQGIDMEMGFNRVQLEAAGGGDYRGNGMLPVCVRYAMEWEARVLVQTDHGMLSAPFRFITVTPGMTPPER